nr:alpha-1,6-glucosidase domain-containing protein [Brachybacterium muris]
MENCPVTTPDPSVPLSLTDLAHDSSPGVEAQRAHFLTETVIAWPQDLASPQTPGTNVDVDAGSQGTDDRARSQDADGCRWELWTAPTGGLALADGQVAGGERLGTLTPRERSLTDAELEDRRHLEGFLALELSGVDRPTLEAALTGQLAVAQLRSDRVEVLTGVQIPGVLDALYAEQASVAPLGPRLTADGWEVSLWAPTATRVALQLDGGEHGADSPLPMHRDRAGIWRATGPATGPGSWTDRSYLFEVEVYVPAEDRVLTNLVTDPYSVGLTVDSERSVLVDLTDERWAPPVWEGTPAPRLERPAQQTIYELHVRDFSAGDEALPVELRGTYLAFGHPDSTGTARLRELAQAGLTTLHLLPTYDIATVPELRSRQQQAMIPAGAGPASADQQAAVGEVADQDAYNWGYDPFHYLAPEGSYATEGHQDGGERIAQFRTMVGELHAMGLQVVLDVVFNHTAHDGQHQRSVLDRIVPGYYHRLDLDGVIADSACNSNTATEHAMMRRLMVDAVVLWVRHYRVDGFRFDLMGHHRRQDMVAVREALDALTPEADGVDGTRIYLYGEGWNFGEVADNARFTQATQGQLDGTSIGCFNDRIRDAVHGGSLMDPDPRMNRGFATGLFFTPNELSPDSAEQQRADLLHRTDQIRLSMAGNLKDFELLASTGDTLRGEQLDYNGSPAGFASRPEETVNYVDAHDNETLFDTFVWKLPQDAPMEVRVRLNHLALATVALGQSPAFWASGTDLLRSKSLDTDSYNSGDLVNTIDWTMRDNGFGRGLPSAARNQHLWERQGPMLEDPAKRPTPEQIADSAAMALDLLRLRHSTPLFTLGDAELIHHKVTFPSSGPGATPGLLVMRIDDTAGPDADPALDGLLVVFNSSPEAITEQIDGMAGIDLGLSPIQANGADPVVRETTWDARTGTVGIPAHTVAVLLQHRR